MSSEKNDCDDETAASACKTKLQRLGVTMISTIHEFSKSQSRRKAPELFLGPMNPFSSMCPRICLFFPVIMLTLWPELAWNSQFILELSWTNTSVSASVTWVLTFHSALTLSLIDYYTVCIQCPFFVIVKHQQCSGTQYRNTNSKAVFAEKLVLLVTPVPA